MKRSKILAYVKGEINDKTEISEILDWIYSSENNQKEYSELKNLWVLSGLENFDSTQYLLQDKKDRSGYDKVIQFVRSASKYAAVFVLAFLLGGLLIYLSGRGLDSFYSAQFNEIVVPKGERSMITLYDGTKVWLNSGTTFKYPVAFSRKERKVHVNGEAYFDVAKSDGQKFIVHAGKLNVEVLGTSFDVCAYRGDDNYYVTLEEGSVMTSCSKAKGFMKLKPGYQAIYNCKSNQFEKRKVNTELFSSWKEDKLKFDNAMLDEVFTKMERWYGVNITIGKRIDTSQRYTFTVTSESLREMLTLLTKTLNINYEINEDQVLITKP